MPPLDEGVTRDNRKEHREEEILLWSSSENTICHSDKEAQDGIRHQLRLQTLCSWRDSHIGAKIVHVQSQVLCCSRQGGGWISEENEEVNFQQACDRLCHQFDFNDIFLHLPGTFQHLCVGELSEKPTIRLGLTLANKMSVQMTYITHLTPEQKFCLVISVLCHRNYNPQRRVIPSAQNLE